jgi:hypothetical protein
MVGAIVTATPLPRGAGDAATRMRREDFGAKVNKIADGSADLVAGKCVEPWSSRTLRPGNQCQLNAS